MTNLIRLDLSFNNIVKLNPKIGDMINLQQLWLNDNPLREVPVEISQCLKLRELDLKNTFVISLPRELANLTNLLIMNMDNCPMKESLGQTYQSGMVTMHTELRRKEDRKLYKEKLFDTLTEWIYPSQAKEDVFERIEQLFIVLKDCSTEMLKKLHRNVQMLFPVKFDDIDPMIIRQKLLKLYDEGIAREDIGQLVLRIKSHFLDESLEDVVKLATDIFNNVKDQTIIDQFFKFKSNIFLEPLGRLSAAKLNQNLENYKEFKRLERIEMIEKLKQSIDQLYADEKIKEERLVEYTQGLVGELKSTNRIIAFTKILRVYMPKYNELKHFNAQRIVSSFMEGTYNKMQNTQNSNTLTYY